MANYPLYNYVPQPLANGAATGNQYNSYISPQPYQAVPYQPQYPIIPQSQLSSSPAIRGRIISREEEITPNEVAMDGQVSLFPLSDYSCIVAKIWDSNGQIQTFKFVPLVEQTVEQEVQDKSDMILGRLDDIESLLKKNGYRTNYRKNQNGSRNEEKKEEVDDA